MGNVCSTGLGQNPARQVLIGMGAVLLNGCRIERGAFVGAGAVVGEGFVVPAGTFAAGVPAS